MLSKVARSLRARPSLRPITRAQATVSHTALRDPEGVQSARADFQQVPAPRGLPLVGTALALMMRGSAAQLHKYVDERHAQLGPVYRESIGPVEALFVADPNEMRRVFQREGKYPRHLLPDAWQLYNQLYGCKRGLFFMDGEEWLHFRRIMNPLFLKNESNFEDPCRLVTLDTLDRWSAHAYNEVPDLENDLYRWSAQVLVATMVGPEAYAAHGKAITANRSFNSLIHEMRSVFIESAKLSTLPARLARALRLPTWARFERAVDRAIHGASSLVLDLLPYSRGGQGMLECFLSAGMELKDVVRIVADLVLAAGDTSALTMQWALYLLAKHPEAQERSVNDPAYLKRVMKEAMRLYPVAPFLTRVLPEESEIAGYNIPAGNLVLLSMYTSGRSAAHFPDPSKFWPDRWLRDDVTGGLQGVSNASATLPFAMGARSCIGRKLAETQLSSLTTKLLSEYKLELVEPERDVDIVLRLTCVPNSPVRIRLVPHN